MRVDKFLKVSRLAKRRSEAHEALVAGRIERDGKALKPGAEINVGDVLVLHYARKFLTVRVTQVPERITSAVHRLELYEILGERRDDPVDWLETPLRPPP